MQSASSRSNNRRRAIAIDCTSLLPARVMTASRALIGIAGPASDETERFEFRGLPTDRGLITANLLGKRSDVE
jgi:hypothetical protein